jgi:hypothetical protein
VVGTSEAVGGTGSLRAVERVLITIVSAKEGTKEHKEHGTLEKRYAIPHYHYTTDFPEILSM